MLESLSETYPQIAVAIAIVAVALVVVTYILKILKNKQAVDDGDEEEKTKSNNPKPNTQVELLRQVNNLVRFFTNDNGEPKEMTSCVVDEKMFHHHEKRFDTIESEIGSQKEQLQALDDSIKKLDEGQVLILDYITNGKNDKQKEIEKEKKKIATIQRLKKAQEV